MKTKNNWIVALLTTITFGAYSIYWFAVQRAAIQHSSKKEIKIPHWLWLLIPVATSMVLLLPIIVTIMLFGFGLDLDSHQISIAIYVALAVLFLIPMIITIWWLTYFGKAYADITKNRITRGLTIALFIFIGPYVILFHQYYINQIAKKQNVNEEAKNYPTTGFLALAAFLIILSIVSYISSFVELPDSIREFEQSIEEGKVEFKEGSEAINNNQLEQEEILNNRTHFN